ncbi:XdhC family protein [Aeromicrobium sp.]|uniref:XdhC family protein n=1 Tax=Aeromicrobium sp. TaxID=1871063 RepID=UPI0035127603
MTVADDALASAARWVQDSPVALATVVGTSGSAPRQAGAAMVVAADGRIAGSVSGGCVEAAVVDLAEATLTSGEPTLRTFGFAADDLFDVGLTCGGRIEVLVQRVGLDDGLGDVAARVAAGDAVAVVTVLEHPDPRRVGERLVVDGATLEAVPADAAPAGSGATGLRRALQDRAQAMLASGATGVVHCGPDGSPLASGVRAFVQTWTPPPRLVVLGAVDFARARAGAGRFLGYDVTVCDARPAFTTGDRFPDAHRVVVDWPHRYLDAEVAAGRIDARTVVCVLTHDARFDVPTLTRALRLPVAYVGAMGSRRTHRERLEQLRAAGLTGEELDRLHSPLGLDLGARTPEETAISILAEVVAVRRGGTGRGLGDTDGPIHGARSRVGHSGSVTTV